MPMLTIRRLYAILLDTLVMMILPRVSWLKICHLNLICYVKWERLISWTWKTYQHRLFSQRPLIHKISLWSREMKNIIIIKAVVKCVIMLMKKKHRIWLAHFELTRRNWTTICRHCYGSSHKSWWIGCRSRGSG